MDVLDSELSSGTQPNRIAFLTFTKKAAEVAQVRAMDRFNFKKQDLPYFRTLHSLAFQRLGLRRDEVLQRKNYLELGKHLGLEFSSRADIEEGLPSGRFNGDRYVFLDGYARAKCMTAEQAWSEAGGEDDLDWHEFKRFRSVLESYKTERNLLDFSDMLEQCQGYLGIDVCILDEAQDLSALQWAFARRILGGAKRIYIAGDDDQCQPSGTMVETADGLKDIADIVPGVDKVIVYDRVSGYTVGRRNGGYDFEKAVRLYSGKIYKLTADSKSSKCTPEHRWLVRWTPEATSQKLNAVYVMKKGDSYRIGWCQLFNKDRAFHLGCRMRLEKADAVWIIDLYDNKQDASMWESILAAKYGIPTVPFEPVNGANYMTQEYIDRIFQEVDSETGALRLLKDKNKHHDIPFYTPKKGEDKKGGSQVFKLEACNVIPGLMRVLLPERIARWTDVQALSFEEVENIPVWSLNVDKYHTYIADGLITCNCIFQWSGADITHFQRLAGNKVVLDQSFRIPTSVHMVAESIARRIGQRYPKSYRPAAHTGSVEYHLTPDDVDLSVSGTWLLLARNVHLLPQLVAMARAQGLPYQYRGESTLNPTHIKAIKAWEQQRKGRSISPDEQSAIDTLLPTSKHVVTGKIWHEALVKIPVDDREYYISLLRRGESLTKEPRVNISTIHGVKGGESENVLLMTDMSSRTFQSYQNDPDSEHRCYYVGATRARTNLHIISPQGRIGYDI